MGLFLVGGLDGDAVEEGREGICIMEREDDCAYHEHFGCRSSEAVRFERRHGFQEIRSKD